MGNRRMLSLSVLFLAAATPAFADKPPLDCSKKPLAAAVAAAGTGDVITFTGICAGPITVQTDGLTLTGTGTAIIDGGGQDAVRISGAHNLVLSNFEARNGANGIIGVNGAHIALSHVSVHDNQAFGISLQTASSAILSGISTTHNGIHGLDLETGSAATVTQAFTSSSNRVFGINVNGSSITFSQASVTLSGNAIGMQVATSGNAFLNDSTTVINATDNQAVGLTVVSGAHMVSFGGTINASGNPLDGVSVNSKAGLDLDAGSQLNAFNNGDGVLVQEGSVMTVFNIPLFSGSSGISTINTHNNLGSGMLVENGSTVTFSNQAKLVATQNAHAGLLVDSAVVTLVNSSLSLNTQKDLVLTFGTRADLQTTLGTYSCDATVLVRGSAPVSCPH